MVTPNKLVFFVVMIKGRIPPSKYFTRFKKSIKGHSLPERFTYPFFYEPHPLCLLAVEQLQEYLQTQKEWVHDFGIEHFVDGVNVGKMFGVLLVETTNGEIGFLSAFSGKIGGKAKWPNFVPPIVDYLDKSSFYRQGEKAIMAVSAKADELEQNETYIELKKKLEQAVLDAEKEIESQKELNRQAKKNRKKIRSEKLAIANESERNSLLQQLSDQSKRDHFVLKDLNKSWKEKLTTLRQEFQTYQDQIDTLRTKRKTMSAALQQDLFERYQFLDYKGNAQDLCSIFEDTTVKVPPSGAGDCCAPKLLQHAYQNKLRPLALAEFWWGQSPKSEIRKHGYFYPSCKGKCFPILGHMLNGLEVDPSPISIIKTDDKELETLFEDEHMLVLVKPHDFLSVPGKTNSDSVLARIQKQYPKADGPIIVHRLDRATSGIMLIAKTKLSHQALQEQFRTRVVKKTYIAILDGTLDQKEGTINLPIRPDLEDRPRQLVCDIHGKDALTYWKVLDVINQRTRIEFKPITGRTHQLRVHAAHHMGLNIPILGDDLYGKSSDRLHLHAQSISFVHPINNKYMKFTSNDSFQID